MFELLNFKLLDYVAHISRLKVHAFEPIKFADFRFTVVICTIIRYFMLTCYYDVTKYDVTNKNDSNENDAIQSDREFSLKVRHLLTKSSPPPHYLLPSASLFIVA